MMNRFVAIFVCLLTGLAPTTVSGQVPQEYIQSTSPTADGGTVTTIYRPGNASAAQPLVAYNSNDPFAINVQRPVQVPAPVVANQVPSLGVPAPVTTPAAPRWLRYRYPVTVGVPQTTNVQYPAVPVTAYSPIVMFRNLPPGTYLGQGFLGQPKAYVDGQPVRNLVRYVLP